MDTQPRDIKKVREGRKVVPSSKMPDLGWDIAETKLQKDSEQVDQDQESSETNTHLQHFLSKQ